MTILLSTDLLATTLLLLLYPLLLFLYLPNLSLLSFLLKLLIPPFYTPYFSNSFPHTEPIVFPGGPPEFPYFGVPLSGSSSTFSKTVPLPSYPIPSMVTPIAKPIAFSPNGPQSMSSFGPYRRRGRSSRGTYSGRGRAPRGRRGITTSTTSCQTSPIPSYFWPDYQPGLVSSRGSSANEALNLALMPRVFDHFPASLPLNPLHL